MNKGIPIDNCATSLQHPIYRKYNSDGIFIAEYGSIKEAARETGICETSIRRCLAGKRCTAGHCFWRIEELDSAPLSRTDMESTVCERKNKDKFTNQRPVYMIDVNSREVVKEFSSINEAAKSLGIDKKCIFDVLRGLQKTAGGYFWVEQKNHTR